MRHSFYPTLYQSGGSAPVPARLLTSTDFPNTTTLYGWQAGASGILTTAYGGINLSALFDDGYNLGTDHIGNSVKCVGDDDLNGVAEESSLSLSTSESFSIVGWFKLDDWESSDSFVAFDNFRIKAETFEYNGITVFIDGASNNIQVIVLSDGELTYQNDVAHNLTGNGWHQIAVTRDVSTTYTKVYLDGSLLDSQNIATSWTDETFSYVLDSFYDEAIFGGGQTDHISGTDIWMHKGTVLTQPQIEALYLIGTGS